MPAWRLVVDGGYWLDGVRPPDQSCSHHMFPVSVPRDARSWRAQIRSVMLRLLTEPHEPPDSTLDVCLGRVAFFLVSRSRRSNGPEASLPGRLAQPLAGTAAQRTLPRPLQQEAFIMAHDDAPHKPLVPLCICPHCGHRHSGYDHQASAVLDLALVTREALSTATDALSTASEALQTLTHVVEEEVLP